MNVGDGQPPASDSEPPSNGGRSHYIVGRWAISLIEPLYSLSEREEINQDLLEAAEEDPVLVAELLGGVAGDIAATLPDDDPWRRHGKDFRLSATIDDHLDQQIPFEPLEIDTNLAAIAQAADAAIIDVIVAAFVSATAASRALAAGAPSAQRLVELGYETIRWLQYRRRSYTGVLDEWIIECAMVREDHNRLPEPNRRAAVRKWAERVSDEKIPSTR